MPFTRGWLTKLPYQRDLSHLPRPCRPPRLANNSGTRPSWPCSPQPKVYRSPPAVSITKWSFPEGERKAGEAGLVCKVPNWPSPRTRFSHACPERAAQTHLRLPSPQAYSAALAQAPCSSSWAPRAQSHHYCPRRQEQSPYQPVLPAPYQPDSGL